MQQYVAMALFACLPSSGCVLLIAYEDTSLDVRVGRAALSWALLDFGENYYDGRIVLERLIRWKQLLNAIT